VPVVFALLALAAGALSAPALAGRRAALVISNSRYQEQARPAAAGNAAQTAKMLRGMSFAVNEAKDLDRKAMTQAFTDFVRGLQGASIALIYYSGKAASVSGRDYLLPVAGKVTR
jgi:uncharacterized caspase-like protein